MRKEKVKSYEVDTNFYYNKDRDEDDYYYETRFTDNNDYYGFNDK